MLAFATTLWGQCYEHSHFTGGEIETSDGLAARKREPEFESEQSNSRVDKINYDTISQLKVLLLQFWGWKGLP